MAAIDAIALAADMIRRPSVTPADAGALDVLQRALEGLGFTCHRLTFEEPGTDPVENLYARRGDTGRNFCFAGHTDVVPPGDAADWSVDPFDAALKDGNLVGRGACDMKGAIACFVAATERFLAEADNDVSISLLITGDEEGPAVNGTRKVLEWLAERGERIDACLVGEPTNPTRLGEMIKVGRRGSLNARITVNGTQGHAAYPHLADNPINRLVSLLDAVIKTELDGGSEHFQPSTLAVTTVDVGNAATNVIPAKASAGLNIRFNDRHTGASLTAWLEDLCQEAGGDVDLDISVSGESFLRQPDEFAVVIADAAEAVLGERPEYSTTGGTSDARFIKDYCPVAEFGLVGPRGSVRINGLDTHYMYRDVIDVIEQTGDRLDLFMIPKVGTAADVYAVDMLVTQCEDAKGRTKRIGFEMIIETALGMANVDEIAGASKRNESLHFGVADYAASTKARTTVIGGPNPLYGVLTDIDGDKPRDYHWGDMWHYAVARMVVAARANGLRPIDGPFGDFKDPDGFRAQANRASVLGCEGKWAIHPSQVDIANEVNSPSEAEVDKAKRILEAMEKAQKEGQGAVSLDGRLIDIASIKQAEVMVRKAEQIAGAA